ncbi:hypothetical protein Rctr85_060 [Virus Rctr85]|nr:hypothetical protein Rctr85_060 [Virus Rctr85]
MDDLKWLLALKRDELAKAESQIEALEQTRDALEQHISSLEVDIHNREYPGEGWQIGEELVKSAEFYALMLERGYDRSDVDQSFPRCQIRYLDSSSVCIVGDMCEILVPLEVARTMKKSAS